MSSLVPPTNEPTSRSNETHHYAFADEWVWTGVQSTSRQNPLSNTNFDPRNVIISTVNRNGRGGFFENGHTFGRSEWMRIIGIYVERCAEKEQCTDRRRSKTCTIRELAEAARISPDSAAKTIKFFRQGKVDVIPQGHGLWGVGSMKGETVSIRPSVRA